MSAPLPLQGTTNPFTAGYQKRQFGYGDLYVQDLQNNVFSSLNTLTTAQSNTMLVNPLEEQVDVTAVPQTGIVPN